MIPGPVAYNLPPKEMQLPFLLDKDVVGRRLSSDGVHGVMVISSPSISP